MPTYDIELRTKGDNKPVLRKTVIADGWANALQEVLEQFKNDSRTADAKSWDVTIKETGDG